MVLNNNNFFTFHVNCLTNVFVCKDNKNLFFEKYIKGFLILFNQSQFNVSTLQCITV